MENPNSPDAPGMQTFQGNTQKKFRLIPQKYGKLAFFVLVTLIYTQELLASKVYLMVSPDRSRVYLDGEFKGTYSKKHEDPMELWVNAGEHVIEVFKEDGSSVLLYKMIKFRIEKPEWKNISLELEEHPDSRGYKKKKKYFKGSFDEMAYLAVQPYYGFKKRYSRVQSSYFSNVQRPVKETLPIEPVISFPTPTPTPTPKQVKATPELEVVFSFNPMDSITERYLGYLSYRKEKKKIAEKQLRYEKKIARPNAHKPTMLEIPSGSFWTPHRNVNVRAFFLSTLEVTVAEWRECAETGICKKLPGQDEIVNDEQPVTGVSPDDAWDFIGWLRISHKVYYRLPTNIEWEYAANADKFTLYPWGDQYLPGRARCVEGSDKNSTTSSSYYPVSVGSFDPNALGLYDMIGNAADLTSGSTSRETQNGTLRGGSWKTDCALATIKYTRNVTDSKTRNETAGFRLAFSKSERQSTNDQAGSQVLIYEQPDDALYFCDDGLGGFLIDEKGIKSGREKGYCMPLTKLKRYMREHGQL